MTSYWICFIQADHASRELFSQMSVAILHPILLVFSGEGTSHVKDVLKEAAQALVNSSIT